MANKYTNLTTNTTTDVVRVRGRTHIHISGDFGGGTLTLQYRDPGDNWRNIVQGSWTDIADDVFDFTDRIDTPIRASLAGATAPNLHVDIRGGR